MSAVAPSAVFARDGRAAAVEWIGSRFASSHALAPESVSVFARRFSLATGHAIAGVNFEAACLEAGFSLVRRRDGSGSRLHGRWLGLPDDVSVAHGRALREAVERSIVPVDPYALRDVVAAVASGVRGNLARPALDVWRAFVRAAAVPDVYLTDNRIRCVPPLGFVFDDAFLWKCFRHPYFTHFRLLTPEVIVMGDVPSGAAYAKASELARHARHGLVRE